jgi:signal transduction histidine kinase/CheY-like chemotaxis protein
VKIALLTIELQAEPDVVLARQRARVLAELLDFDLQDQTRIATAVSEVARNAFQYGDRGRIQFTLERSDEDIALGVRVSDRGPGIPDLTAVLEGAYHSKTGMGVGLRGARKLMEDFRIESSPAGTVVEMSKHRPARGARSLDLAQLTARLAAQSAKSPMEEVRHQNLELIRTLEELKAREEELNLLNRELAETNTGVLALYTELEEKAESLRGSSALKARFHSQMSHEIRTPINAILSISEILLNGTVVAPLPEQEKPLGFIRKAAHQLSELVNDLLDLAKVEAGKMMVRGEEVSVPELFGALRGMFRPLHRNDAVRLIFEETAHLPPLHSDEGKLSQVLRNFISNALKFTEQGEVRVSAELDGEYVVFAVSDTGIGIAVADQPLLFRDFIQIESARQRSVHGTGLGLTLARELAELLEGSVSVTSTEGVGSIFRLTVPLTTKKARPAARPPQQSSETRPPLEQGQRPGILLIDDDEAARYVLRTAIGPVPFSVIEVSNGHDGLRIARARQPHVIFLDLTMPGIDGFEVLTRLKADPETSALPVVIHSGRRLSEEERARLAPVTLAILEKTPHHTDAIPLVQEALRKAGLRPSSPGER